MQVMKNEPPKKRKKAQDAFVISSDNIQIMATKRTNGTVAIKFESNDLEIFFKAMHEAEEQDQCLSGENKRAYDGSRRTRRARTTADVPAESKAD